IAAATQRRNLLHRPAFWAMLAGLAFQAAAISWAPSQPTIYLARLYYLLPVQWISSGVLLDVFGTSDKAPWGEQPWAVREEHWTGTGLGVGVLMVVVMLMVLASSRSTVMLATVAVALPAYVYGTYVQGYLPAR